MTYRLFLKVSVAYYPDTRQEQFFKLFGIDEHVDLMYAMSYDQSGPNHSSKELAKQTIRQAKDAELMMSKVCVGVPFYGRDNRGGKRNFCLCLFVSYKVVHKGINYFW